MRKINKTSLLLIAFALVFFTSCYTELEVDHAPLLEDETSTEVNIKLNSPNSFLNQTRSLSELQESAVNNACILAFKTDVLSYVKIANTIDSDKRIKVTVKTSDNASDSYKLMVLANANDFIQSLAGNELNLLNGKTYMEIQQLLNQSDINEPMYASGGSIVMWGELPYQEIKSSNNNFSIHLVRSIARVDVGLGATSFNTENMLATWGGLSNFALEGVYVYKPNDAFSFIPLSTNFNDTNKKAISPSSIGTKLSFPFFYPVTGGKSIVQSIYIPEADVKMGEQGTSGDMNHTNRMAIIVKGSYNGNASSYYRLDFINSDKTLTNVLRNHLYQFNIKSVSGNGYSTPDDAYNSQANNMDVEVLEWNDGAIGEIAFDSQYMLGVTKAQFILPKDQRTAVHTDNKLTITTDYPDGWSIEKIVDENGDFTNANWLTLSRYVGWANQKTTVSILTDENVSGVERKAYIHIKAGRLQYVVEVIQTTKLKTIPKKKLLTIGSSADQYGYNFSGTAASNKLITSSMNFGDLPESIVKADGFTIIDGGQNPTLTQMAEWLINNPVDMVIIGFDNLNLNSSIARYYVQYLENGGVVLAFQDRIENTVSGNLLKFILNSDITISYATGPGSVYRFSNLDDEVLNGPFGDIRGKQWGEDASTTVRIKGVDADLIDILSDDQDISWTTSTGTGAITAFKHKILNFIWVGDGGFNSNNGGTGSTICPFKLNASNFPVYKPEYGRGNIKHPVYNSVFTANAIAWALKQSEINGINS